MLSKDLNKNYIFNFYFLLIEEARVVLMSISFPPVSIATELWKLTVEMVRFYCGHKRDSE